MRRLFLAIQRIEATLLSSAMLAIAAVTILNVLARNLLGHNIAAAEELNRLLIVLICFVGLGYAAGQGRHIRMTALYDQLGPRGRKALMVLISATTAALMFVLAWYAWAYARGVERSSPVLGVPLGLVYLAAPLGFVLAGLQYVLTLWRNLTSDEVWIAFDRQDGYEEA